MNTPGGIEELDNLPSSYEGLVHYRITSEEFWELFRDSEENPDEHITALIGELRTQSLHNMGTWDAYRLDEFLLEELIRRGEKNIVDYATSLDKEGNKELKEFNRISLDIVSWDNSKENIDALADILKKTPKKLQEFLWIFILADSPKNSAVGENVLEADIDTLNNDDVLPVICAKFAHYALSDEEFNRLLHTVYTTSKLYQSQQSEKLTKAIFPDRSTEATTGTPAIHTIIRALFKAIRLQDSQNFVHPYTNHDVQVESDVWKRERKEQQTRSLDSGFTQADNDFIEAQAAVVRWKWTREQINLVEEACIRHPFKLDFFLHLYAHQSLNSPEAELAQARRIFSGIGLDYDRIREEAEAKKVTGIQEDYSGSVSDILEQ